MTSWPEAERVQADGCAVLAGLTRRGNKRTRRLVVNIVVETLKRLAHSELVSLGVCCAVQTLARTGAGVDVLVDLGVCEALSGALTKHRDHDRVPVEALKALALCTCTREGKPRVKALPCHLVFGSLGRIARDREYANVVLLFLTALATHAGTTLLSYLVEAKAVDAVRLAAGRWADHAQIQESAALMLDALTRYCTGAHKDRRSAPERLVNAGASVDTGERQEGLGGCRVEGRSDDHAARTGGVVDDGSDIPSGGGGAAVVQTSISRSQARRRRRKKGPEKATTGAGGNGGAVIDDDNDDDIDSTLQSHEALTGALSCGAARGAGSSSNADTVEPTERRTIDVNRACSAGVNEPVGNLVAMSLDGGGGVDGRAGGGLDDMSVHTGDDAAAGRGGIGADGRGDWVSDGGGGAGEAHVPPAVDREDADGSSDSVNPQPYSCDAGSKGVSVDRPLVEHELTTRAVASAGGGCTDDDVKGVKGEKASSSRESWPLGRLGETLLCPIFLEVMVDPVVAADGITYCRQALQQHIDYARQNEVELRSPTTGLPMQAGFHDNVLVRSLAREYMEAQRQQDSTA